MDFSPVYVVALGDQVLAVSSFHELAELIRCIDEAGHTAESIHRLHVPSAATVEEILAMGTTLMSPSTGWGGDME